MQLTIGNFFRFMTFLGRLKSSGFGHSKMIRDRFGPKSVVQAKGLDSATVQLTGYYGSLLNSPLISQNENITVQLLNIEV